MDTGKMKHSERIKKWIEDRRAESIETPLAQIKEGEVYNICREWDGESIGFAYYEVDNKGLHLKVDTSRLYGEAEQLAFLEKRKLFIGGVAEYVELIDGRVRFNKEKG